MSKEKNPHAVALGKKSIKAQREKYGKDVFKERMEKARKTRWPTVDKKDDNTPNDKSVDLQ